MNILTVEKQIIDLVELDDEIPETQFTVVDLGSDAKSYDGADVIFPRLVYVEDYSGPAIECDVMGNTVILPLAWNIFIGEEDISEVELIPMTALNARDFSVIITNPIDGFRHYFSTIRVKSVYTDYDWVLPKIKNGQALAIPINTDTENPLCLYITHSSSKIPPISSANDFI
jgi:hypothetical protein